MKNKPNNPIRRISAPDRVFSYFLMEKKTLSVVTVSGILYNIGLLAGPWFEGQLAQTLVDILGGTKVFSDMLLLAASYVAVTAFVQLMRFVKRFYVRRFANNINWNMKSVIYFGLVHMGKSVTESENIGSIMTKAISDVDACAEGMRKFTTEVFDTGIALLAYVAMLFYYDWRLALLSCIFPPFAYVIADRMKVIVQKCTVRYRESSGRLAGATLDRVSNAVTYRVFGCEKQRDRVYEGYLADNEKSAVKANIWVAAMPPVYQILSMASVLFIIYFGARNVLQTGWTSWNIAAFTTFLACFAKLAVKSSKAAKLFNSVQQAQVSWKRIKSLMCRPSEEKDIAVSVSSVLSVLNLDFGYQNGAQILKGISFEASPGQIIGITGPVACGKSTLGKVFLCEYPYDGSICFAGKELSEMTSELRSGIVCYMGHDPELMSDTVEQNVLLGDSLDATEYLKAVCLDREVSEMPDGVLTPVGSGGVRLSGGQQARLALARTVSHRKPVMILDDPFSAVDKKTEAEIFANLKKLASDSIILLISHRLCLFSEFDRVIWMENGRAIVSTHERLMAENPQYAGLYRTQCKVGNADEK